MSPSRLVAVLALASVAASGWGRQWPDDPGLLTSSFSEPGDGGFSRGLAFRSEGQRIGAWSDGEVIWMSGPDEGAGAPGSGLVVIEHPGGFRSSYRGVAYRPDLGAAVAAGDWVGYADGSEWVFGITDTERERIIDPLASLPARTASPVPSMASLVLSGRDGETVVRDQMTVSPGKWTVYAEPSASVNGLAIVAELSLYWVGQSIAGLRFDSLTEEDGVVVMETPEIRTFDGVFGPEGRILLGEVSLNAGRGVLELRVRNDTGRIVSRSWRLDVRSDG